ncbi:hypothetical protein [Microbacterium sp. PMB16]|uniref:hypothetical protein n=1 Tax=Microbacterium sp. PMB16 TaxID=3120157 RepID=UPI003F4C9BB2
MSEPQQPPVPPSAQPNSAFPPAPPAAHLPAAPQYPAQPYQAPQPQAYPAQPQPYATSQPHQPAQPQAQPQGYPATPQGYPATPQYPGAPKPVGEGNGLGRTAFLIAVITAGLNLVISLFTPFLYMSSGGFETANVLTSILGVISLLAYAAALVLALIAAKRPGARLLVGVAIGIAGVGAVGLLIGFVSSFFYRFL